MRSLPSSVDQHRIAVGKEAIAFANRGPIRIEDSLASAERANEREQRGARQMEIREQEIYRSKAKTRLDEESSFAGRCAGLERANDRRSDGNDRASFGARLRDPSHARLGNLERLGVHRMIVEVFGGDGAQGSE